MGFCRGALGPLGWRMATLETGILFLFEIEQKQSKESQNEYLNEFRAARSVHVGLVLRP